jgi:hypothetical protein
LIDVFDPPNAVADSRLVNRGLTISLGMWFPVGVE